jgi:hypothetical protein
MNTTPLVEYLAELLVDQVIKETAVANPAARENNQSCSEPLSTPATQLKSSAKLLSPTKRASVAHAPKLSVLKSSRPTPTTE